MRVGTSRPSILAGYGPTAVQLCGALPGLIRSPLSTATLATANTSDADSSADWRATGGYKTRIDRIFLIFKAAHWRAQVIFICGVLEPTPT